MKTIPTELTTALGALEQVVYRIETIIAKMPAADQTEPQDLFLERMLRDAAKDVFRVAHNAIETAENCAAIKPGAGLEDFEKLKAGPLKPSQKAA